MGISVRDTEEEARQFVAEKGLAFANGRDPDLKIARAFKVEGTPTTFFITPAGEILDRHEGTFQGEELMEGLQALLGYKSPAGRP